MALMRFYGNCEVYVITIKQATQATHGHFDHPYILLDDGLALSGKVKSAIVGHCGILDLNGVVALLLVSWLTDLHPGHFSRASNSHLLR